MNKVYSVIEWKLISCLVLLNIDAICDYLYFSGLLSVERRFVKTMPDY